MSDAEHLVVMSAAFRVFDGAVTLADATADVTGAELRPDDVAGVRRVSGLVRRLLTTDAGHALVLATLNDVVAARSGDHDLRLLTRFDLSNTYVETGRPADALPLLDRVHDDLADRDVRGVAAEAVAGNRAVVRAQLGDVAGGIDALRALIERSARGPDRSATGRWRLNLAVLAASRDRYDEARAAYRAAIEDFAAALPTAGSAGREVKRLHLAASIGAAGLAQRAGDPAEAIDLLRPVAEVSIELNAPDMACESFTVLARSLIDLDRTEQAMQALASVIDVHVETGAAAEPHWVVGTYARLASALGRTPEAVAQFDRSAARAAELGRAALRTSLTAASALLDAERGTDRRAALARVESLPDPATRIDVLVEMGRRDVLAARHDAAAAALNRAAELARAVADPHRTARVDQMLGAALLAAGDLAGAAGRLQRAAAVFAETGEEDGEASARADLSAAYVGLGQAERATEQADRARELAVRLDDPQLVAATAAALASTRELAGDPAAALAGYTEAGDIARRHDVPASLARYLEGKGNVLRNLDRAADALSAYDEALAACRRAGDTDREASVTVNRSVLLTWTGRAEEALRGLTRGVAEARRLGNDWLLSLALTHLADAHWQAGNADDARRALDEARRTAMRRGYPEHLWRQAVKWREMAGGDDAVAGGEVLADLIQRVADAPGAGRRPDMAAVLADLWRELAGTPSGDAGGESAQRLVSRLSRRLGVEMLDAGDPADAAPDAGADPGPDWAGHARRFVATGDRSHLRAAVTTCDDERAREVLAGCDTPDGLVPRTVWEPAVRELSAAGRTAAALALNLVAIHPLLVAGRSATLTERVDRAATAACTDALAAVTALRFEECRAAVCLTLGARAADHDDVDDALAHLLRSAGIYARLAAREPEVYRGGHAEALNRLGSLLGGTGDLGLARRLYRRAITVLTPAGDVPELLPVLHNLAALHVDEHDLTGADRTLREAFAMLDRLPAAQRADHSAIHAALWHEQGRLHSARRQGGAARAAQERAIALTRTAVRRGQVPPAELARALNLLGATVAQGDPAGALPALEEALRLARGTARPRVLISILMHLAGAAGEAGRPERSAAAYREALDLQRALADAQPDLHEARLVDLLTNLGTEHLNARDLERAVAALEEAVERGRRLYRRRVDRSQIVLVAALDRLGAAYAQLGDEAGADTAAARAARVAEEGGDPAEAWLRKGWAATSYHRLLARAVAAGDADEAHACLAALREPDVGVTARRPEDSLRAARDAVAAVPGGVRVVVAERLSGTPGTAFDALGVLGADGLEMVLTDGLVTPARGLRDAVETLFDADTDAGFVGTAVVEAIAGEVMAALPAVVRDALTGAGPTVLISGDPYWSVFPWEALRDASRPDGRWLGLDHPLPRTSGLTAAAFDGLRPETAGEPPPDRTAAVVSPWDADPDRPVELSRREAERVAALLGRHGYTLVPDGAALLGADAGAPGLTDALAAEPRIVHYAGHAGVVDGEEVLILAGRDGAARPFGRTDMARRRAADTGRPLLPRARLVVLNACRAGNVRAFGGRREDLLSTVLAEGARTVVASAFPVDEAVGLAVGTSLYDGPGGETVGAAVVRIRRALAAGDDPVARVLWTLVTCHGDHLTPVL